jgi:hypothetical protein
MRLCDVEYNCAVFLLDDILAFTANMQSSYSDAVSKAQHDRCSMHGSVHNQGKCWSVLSMIGNSDVRHPLSHYFAIER